MGSIGKRLRFGQRCQNRLGHGILGPGVVAQLQASKPKQVLAAVYELLFKGQRGRGGDGCAPDGLVIVRKTATGAAGWGERPIFLCLMPILDSAVKRYFDPHHVGHAHCSVRIARLT